MTERKDSRRKFFVPLIEAPEAVDPHLQALTEAAVYKTRRLGDAHGITTTYEIAGSLNATFTVLELSLSSASFTYDTALLVKTERRHVVEENTFTQLRDPLKQISHTAESLREGTRIIEINKRAIHKDQSEAEMTDQEAIEVMEDFLTAEQNEERTKAIYEARQRQLMGGTPYIVAVSRNKA